MKTTSKMVVCLAVAAAAFAVTAQLTFAAAVVGWHDHVVITKPVPGATVTLGSQPDSAIASCCV